MSDVSEAGTPTKPKRKYQRRKAPDVMQSPRKEVQSADFQIGQHKPISDSTPRDDVGREKSDGNRLFGRRLQEKGELILLDGYEVTSEYLEELAFNEDWLTIFINPSSHKNAASIFENWCNGQGAEMLVNGQVLIIRDLPVGRPITVRRKIVAHIIRARVVNVQTIHENATVDFPRNELIRTSSHVHSFSVLRDPSPKGMAWLEKAYASPI